MTMPAKDSDIITRMSAEFKESCDRIDALANEAMACSLRAAFSAVLSGDTANSDKLRDRAARAEDARKKAKIEAWLRIGEKHGLSRAAALQALEIR